jgi:hypothetical protein
MRFVKRAARTVPGHKSAKRAAHPAREADVLSGAVCGVNSLQNTATEIYLAGPRIDWRITGIGFRRLSLADDLAQLVSFSAGILPN